jgi:hypothetical protein
MSSGMAPAIQATSATVAIAASTVSANAAIPLGSESVLFTNSTASLAFIRGSSGPATASDLPVPSGGRLLLFVGPYAAAVSAILVTGTGAVYCSPVIGTSY